MSLLALSHVVYAAGPKKILDGLDFGIDEGDVHALIGTNGTGKSTLARLIIGSEGFRLSSGQILFAGRDTRGGALYFGDLGRQLHLYRDGRSDTVFAPAG